MSQVFRNVRSRKRRRAPLPCVCVPTALSITVFMSSRSTSWQGADCGAQFRRQTYRGACALHVLAAHSVPGAACAACRNTRARLGPTAPHRSARLSSAATWQRARSRSERPSRLSARTLSTSQAHCTRPKSAASACAAPARSGWQRSACAWAQGRGGAAQLRHTHASATAPHTHCVASCLRCGGVAGAAPRACTRRESAPPTRRQRRPASHSGSLAAWRAMTAHQPCAGAGAARCVRAGVSPRTPPPAAIAAGLLL
jgi:hypothetical protein